MKPARCRATEHHDAAICMSLQTSSTKPLPLCGAGRPQATHSLFTATSRARLSVHTPGSMRHVGRSRGRPAIGSQSSSRVAGWGHLCLAAAQPNAACALPPQAQDDWRRACAQCAQKSKQIAALGCSSREQMVCLCFWVPRRLYPTCERVRRALLGPHLHMPALQAGRVQRQRVQ